MIRIKRIYDQPGRQDGYRVLVDRVWPRGVGREQAKLDCWLKEVAPSTALRKWFGHQPERWEEFREKYWQEVRSQREELGVLRCMAAAGMVTLLFGARDARYNQAAALKDFLEHGSPENWRPTGSSQGRESSARAGSTNREIPKGTACPVNVSALARKFGLRQADARQPARRGAGKGMHRQKQQNGPGRRTGRKFSGPSESGGKPDAVCSGRPG